MGDSYKKRQEEEKLVRERNRLLRRVENILEIPMIILGFIWLILTLIELLKGLNAILSLINNIIWIIFIVDFLIKFIIAPHKLFFLKKNIISAISLAVPALRIFRIAGVLKILRLVRYGRGFRLVRIIGSINRGMRTLNKTMKRRALGFVMLLTLIVWLIGSAGMYAFERDQPEGLDTIGYALWWTAMLMTSLGSQYWPLTAEGRILTFFLGLYGFAVLGYFTATVASYFLGQDAEDEESEIAAASQIRELENKVREVQTDLHEIISILKENQNK